MKYQVGDLTLNDQTWGVTRGEKTIKLSRREFRMLRYLMKNKSRVVSVGELESTLKARPKSNTIISAISYLRKKLGDPNIIENIFDEGYIIRVIN